MVIGDSSTQGIQSGRKTRVEFNFTNKMKHHVLSCFLCFVSLFAPTTTFVLHDQTSSDIQMQTNTLRDIKFENSPDASELYRLPKLHHRTTSPTDIPSNVDEYITSTESQLTEMAADFVRSEKTVGFFRSLKSCCYREVMAPTGGGTLRGPCCEKWMKLGDLFLNLRGKVATARTNVCH